MSTPERDIMHPRNKNVVFGTFAFLLLFTTSFWGTQGTTQSPASSQKVPITPLPSDIDPSDPALPVWARPAKPAASANTSKPATQNQPGQPQQQIQEGT